MARESVLTCLVHSGVRSPKSRGSLGAFNDPKRPQGTRKEAGFLSPGTHRGQDGGEGSPLKHRREGREVVPQLSRSKRGVDLKAFQTPLRLSWVTRPGLGMWLL